MKIAIVGAGFTGLAAGYYLTKLGHEVEIFELDSKPGGLAIGYREKGWKWTLESHYHHWFTNDKYVLELAKEINHEVIITRPKTSSFVDGEIFQLDSPTSLLKFPKISLLERLRMGISLAFLKYNPIWKPLENYRAEPYLKKSMGKSGYKMIWEPLMVNKLGKYAREVSLAWFWARIYKRTESLAYPKGGFLEFAQHLQKVIEKQKGKLHYNTEVVNLTSSSTPTLSYRLKSGKKIEKMNYDRVIVTTPSFLFKKFAPTLPQEYKDSLGVLKGIGAMNLVLRLNQKFFSDGTYWLNMCDLKSPILALVEHTHFMSKKNYNNENLLYVGNYMEITDKRFTMSEKELLKLYDPWLKKINANYKSSIIDFKLFKAPFAQPIIYPKYSKRIPTFVTPLQGVYLVNIEQVYPWDRGTNYAVELGKKITDIVTSI